MQPVPKPNAATAVNKKELSPKKVVCPKSILKKGTIPKPIRVHLASDSTTETVNLKTLKQNLADNFKIKHIVHKITQTKQTVSRIFDPGRDLVLKYSELVVSQPKSQTVLTNEVGVPEGCPTVSRIPVNIFRFVVSACTQISSCKATNGCLNYLEVKQLQRMHTWEPLFKYNKAVEVSLKYEQLLPCQKHSVEEPKEQYWARFLSKNTQTPILNNINFMNDVVLTDLEMKLVDKNVLQTDLIPKYNAFTQTAWEGDEEEDYTVLIQEEDQTKSAAFIETVNNLLQPGEDDSTEEEYVFSKATQTPFPGSKHSDDVIFSVVEVKPPAKKIKLKIMKCDQATNTDEEAPKAVKKSSFVIANLLEDLEKSDTKVVGTVALLKRPTSQSCVCFEGSGGVSAEVRVDFENKGTSVSVSVSNATCQTDKHTIHGDELRVVYTKVLKIYRKMRPKGILTGVPVRSRHSFSRTRSKSKNSKRGDKKINTMADENIIFPRCPDKIKVMDKGTQMKERMTESQFYCIEWICDNLLPVFLNPHTIVIDSAEQSESVLASAKSVNDLTEILRLSAT